MKFNFIKVISLIVVMAMLMASLPISISAAGLPIAVSDAYRASAYYQAACNAYSSYTDPATRFVQVALSQKGYKGGTYSGDWAGNGGGGKYTEYGRFMSKDGQDWCASFVSWSAAAAGIPTNVIPRSAGAGHWKNVNTGTFTKVWSSDFSTYNGYKPQVGDLVLYMPYCKTCYSNTGKYLNYNSYDLTAHVVIVTWVSQNANADGGYSIRIVERGNGNTVSESNLNTTAKRTANCICGKNTPARVVQGFFRPNWSLVGGTTTTVTPQPAVQLTPATQSDYVAKEFVNETNACVVTQITKPCGSQVTQCGLVLMDANGNVLKNHTENVSNVGKSLTLFHSWYDINLELGYTLTKGTTYKYKFFTVADGVRYEGETRIFKTLGKSTYTIYFDANGGSCSVGSKEIEENSLYGTLPIPVRSGYVFAGWYTKKDGGMLASATTYHSSGSDITLYARWTKEEKKTITISYDGHGGSGTMASEIYEYGQTLTVKDCKFKQSGKEFYKWVLYRSADNTYYTPKNGWQLFDVLEQNKYGLEGFDPGDKINVNEEWMKGCTKDGTFYFIAVWTDIEEEEVEEEETDEVVIKLYLNSPKMSVNGKYVNIDNQGTVPCIINDRTMVPIRAVIEALGGTVGWNQNLKQVTLKLDGKTLYLRIGESYAFDENKSYKLDSAPVLVDGRTLLPVRAVVEYFGGSVSWNNSTRSVTIKYSK